MTEPASTKPAFPVGGGAFGDILRRFDWASTGLGPPETWPTSLRALTNVLLQTPLPIVLLWGREGYLIYNEGYAEIAADKHPRILGMAVRDAWPEIADWNSTRLEEAFRGLTLQLHDQVLILNRRGAPEPVYFDLNYSPVHGDDGETAGMLVTVVETTERVLAEQALEAQRQAVIDANRRLSAESAFLQQLFEETPSFIAMLSGPEHKFRLTNAAYRRLIGDRDVVGLTIRQGLPEIEGQGFYELLDHVYATGEAVKIDASAVLLRRAPDAPPEKRILDFIYQPVTNAEGVVTGVFVEGQDVTERAAGEEHLRLVVNELNHRVKNTLAMIQAIAAQTFRNADNLAEAQEGLTGRIMALARANDLLTSERWVGATLGEVVATSLRAHCDAPERLRAEGPPVHLTAKTALALSMALHELATNAVKYGSLSVPAGRIELDWRIEHAQEGERLRFRWREVGGPPVAPPARSGFGARLIQRGLAAEMGGTVALRFEPDGVVCEIDAPLEREGED